MQVLSSYKLVLLGVIATVVAIVSHPFLPDKRLQIVPGDELTTVIYADEASGGNSHASWVDQHNTHWRCDVREGTLYRYCGFHIDFAGGTANGLDLSGYTSVRVKLHVNSSDSRIRLYIRNFEEGFSIPEDIATSKFNNVLLPISELDGELTVELREFSVAEWWINERNVPRQLATLNFDNVLTVGIDLGVPPGIGIHEIRLESFELVGELISTEHWYLAILFCWIAIIVLFGVTRYIKIERRLVLEREMLQALASHNNKLKGESKRYRELSALDQLTGALNRHGFEHVMADLKTARGPTSECALLILDLDHFKQINDSLGHDIGDKVLKNTAEVVGSNIRLSDSLARWGGEEFIVLCPNLDAHGAAVLAEKLRAVIATIVFPLQPGMQVTTSVGVGCFRLDEDFQRVFKRVDNALYVAKKGGRNRIAMAEE